MDIVELKGVNPKMLHGSGSQLHVPAAHRSQGAASRDRHTRNTAYCEFDIIAAHQQEKAKSTKKQKHEKMQKLERGEPSDLSKKIEDLTARNVKIRQMLFAKDTRSTEKLSAEKVPITSDRRHRDKKARRTNKRHDDNQHATNVKPVEKSTVIEQSDKPVKKILKAFDSNEEKKSDKRGKEGKSKIRENKSKERKTEESNKIKITMDTATLQVKEPFRRSKHRSRKDLSEQVACDPHPESPITSDSISHCKSSRKPSKRAASHHVSRHHKDRFTHLEAEIVEEENMESKSQLIKVHNYKSQEKQKPDMQVITVFENTRLFEETESPLSKDTIGKSNTRLPSNTRGASTARHEHKPKHVGEDIGQVLNSKILKDFQKRLREQSQLRANSTPRKVLSFSNLNLQPNAQLYEPHPQTATTQTSASRIETPGFGTVSIAVESGDLDPETTHKPMFVKDTALDLSQTTIALRDIMQVQEFEQQQQSNPRTMRKKFMEPAPLSPHREFLNNKSPLGSALSKNSKFHKSKTVDTSDRIVEISSKTCNDQKVTFTVEGVEPPRRFKLPPDSYKSMKLQSVFNLQVFSGITVNQENDLKCLSHGGSTMTYSNVSNLSRVNNKPLEIFEPSTVGLEKQHSRLKPKIKESTEIGYKFRKKSWQSKELPKRKVSKRVEEKKKFKKKSPAVEATEYRNRMQDTAIQTSNSLHDREVGHGFISQSFLNRVSTDVQTLALDVDVSTSICSRDYTKTIQVGATREDFTAQRTTYLPRPCMHPIRQFSQSESNISFEGTSIHKREFSMCTITKNPSPPPVKTVLVGKSSSRLNVPTSSVETASEQCPKPKKIQPTVVQTRHRKHSHSCVPKPRKSSTACQSAMSTGSIPTPPTTPSPRNTRSKSLNLRRDSLVEKINYNKATIMHHNQEIAALEKCLNEILNRLVRGDSEPKSLSQGVPKLDNPSSRESAKIKAQGLNKKLESPDIPISKFHRAKAYGERLKRRTKRPRDLADAKNSPCSNGSISEKPKPIRRKTFISEKRQQEQSRSPVRVRSVYKNPKGFISSSTSVSSKLSDLLDRSSSTYPQSIPSLNLGCSTVNRYYIRASSSSEHKRKSIVKPKHKLYRKEPVYSKKKSQSIYSLLKEYINLAKEAPSSKSESSEEPEEKAIRDSVSRIVVLSVSSVKMNRIMNLPSKTSPPPVILGKSSNFSKHRYNMVPKQVKPPKPDECAISKKPFFITHNETLATAATQNNAQDLTSADSLEYDTRAPDLCPLTAVFNYEPPTYAYLVYNAEVISPNKPKIEPQPGPSRSYSSAQPSPSSSSKLMPILEEKPAAASPEPSLTFLYRDKQVVTQEPKPAAPKPSSAFLKWGKQKPSGEDKSALITPEPSGTFFYREKQVIKEERPAVATPESSLTFLFQEKQKTTKKENPATSQKTNALKPEQRATVLPQEKQKTIANLSPVLSRKGYPSYTECMKKLEEITSEIPEIPKQYHEPKPKLTSFNCNDRECNQLIFNFTSKSKDGDLLNKPFAPSHSDGVSKTRCPRFAFDRHDSSAYHTMTTILDSNSASMYSDSDVGLKNESGYESSKKSSTFKNFFKKRTLLDVFKSKNAHKKKSESSSTSTLQDTRTASPEIRMSQETFSSRNAFAALEEAVPAYNNNTSKTVMWFNFRKKKRAANAGCDPWCSRRYQSDEAEQTVVHNVCKTECHKEPKCMPTNTWKRLIKNECPCTQPFEKQQEQCHKYASKVLEEAAHRQKGYKKQYEDFEEMPLDVLIGKRSCACKSMKQGCIETFINKAAGIQVKQLQKSGAVQVNRHVSIEEPQQEEELPKGVREKLPELELKEQKDVGKVAKEKEIRPVTPDPPPAPTPVSIPATVARPPKKVSADKRLLNDKELFEKLLVNFEHKEEIATRLTGDDAFFQDQIDSAKAGVVPDIQVYQDHPRNEQDRMRGPRFSDKPRPLVQVTKADMTAVHPDDIGTCFARGFRPDNLMLSGDACFHINKQDKVKMSPYMLKNTESIIDFSERETPLDFLLALGFMVDEASNALKDDDIRSRLHAAITEARVWINKITTTQGTLLYLVAYKARPETMRYFLQLVEAIINKRINNAIRLDGFLRVLEDVEAGRLQMINILGEDKFEDEENEEKIVKKQLKNLFINVYTIAEKEASVTGRKLSSNQITLLRILVAKYRAGLHPHLDLIARYIGQGLLENDIQLEAAMIFLSRLDTADVKLKEFENYCGITCQLQEI